MTLVYLVLWMTNNTRSNHVGLLLSFRRDIINIEVVNTVEYSKIPIALPTGIDWHEILTKLGVTSKQGQWAKPLSGSQKMLPLDKEGKHSAFLPCTHPPRLLRTIFISYIYWLNPKSFYFASLLMNGRYRKCPVWKRPLKWHPSFSIAGRDRPADGKWFLFLSEERS